MERLKFIFGIHNHQPVGNFDHVFRDAVERCYMRQLEVFARHPAIRFTLHTSGPLLEWMSENYPEYDQKVRSMVESGQVEPMGGGFYEPILPAIPHRDAIAQIRLMQAEIERRYGVRPDGLWLPERVWNPSLPELLADAGVRYTAVDDTHFRYAGFTQKPMTGYYISERGGKKTALFPISKELRYLIPFKEPEVIISFLKDVHRDHPGGVITYADDGEKFGIWPGTFDWVYKRGWLSKFLSALEQNADWLEVLPFRDVDALPAGRAYLPTASYDEMMEWSLPTEAILRYKHVRGEVEQEGRLEEYRPFLRGGLWNNFFVKYPESNLMNKRNIYISNRLDEQFPHAGYEGQWGEARRDILRSQCNCAYWHGLFGGVYFNYLRHAVWQHMLRAEAALKRDPSKPEITVIDLDCDGLDETLVEGKNANWGFHRAGGAVFIMENRAKAFAYHNTLARREEAYHHNQDPRHDATQPDETDGPATIHELSRGKMPENPVYDRAPRFSFQDHFFDPKDGLERFISSEWTEMGDFLNGLYSVDSDGESGSSDPLAITFTRDGKVGDADVRLTKRYSWNGGADRLTARIKIASPGPLPPFNYGLGFNFTLLAMDAKDRYYVIPGKKGRPLMKSKGADKNITNFGARDEWSGAGLDWKIDKPATLWRAPVFSLSRSEQRFEKTYQGSWVILSWPLPRDERSFSVEIVLSILGD